MWVEIFKNADVSYLLTTTEMPRGMDRPFLRATPTFFTVWCYTIPKKHSALQNTVYEKLHTSGNWVFNTELLVYKLTSLIERKSKYVQILSSCTGPDNLITFKKKYYVKIFLGAERNILWCYAESQNGLD